MKYSFLSILAVISVFALSSCAPSPTFNQSVLTWQGDNIQSLIGAWGYPQKIKDLPNGDQVYYYEIVPPKKKVKDDTDKKDKVLTAKQIAEIKQKKKHAKELAAALEKEHKLQPLPSNKTGVIVMKKPDGFFAPSLPPIKKGEKRSCTVSFVVNEDNQVIAVHYKGNYCVATDQFNLQMANPQNGDS